MGHGSQPHDGSSVLRDLLLGVLCNRAQHLDRQCDGIYIPSAWSIMCASSIIPNLTCHKAPRQHRALSIVTLHTLLRWWGELGAEGSACR